MIDPPVARDDQQVIDGPTKAGNEHHWRVRLGDGTRALIGQLLPEISQQESVRRRYIYDAERIAALTASSVAPTLAIGPLPDPRDPTAEPPWRLRVDPAGETLDAWLARRAPAPEVDAVDLVARIADAVHEVHTAGGVLRDLEPRNIVLAEDGAIWLIDIGLARVDILSTRTASSLMLESSPYSAPEHLRATVIDQRADVYTLGAIAWHVLTGAAPFDGGPQLFRSSASLPPLGDVAPVSQGLAALVAACLADDPVARPESARDVAEVLRGRASAGGTALVRVTCQACGESLRPGLRLCLSCGKQAVQFAHVTPEAGPDDRYSVVLTKATDDVRFIESLREFFETVAEGPPPELNFITGDARMYSKEERKRLTRVPVPLFTHLSRSTADDLAVRLRSRGMTVKVRHTNTLERGRKRGLRWLLGAGVGAAAGVVVMTAGSLPLGGIVLGVSALVAVGAGISAAIHTRKKEKPPMAWLRAAPAALPASDPLVARIASLLDREAMGADVRERVGELALLVQRMCDHRASVIEGIDGAGDRTDLAMVTEPIEPLVGLIEREVLALDTIDAGLKELDEGAIVRALATSEARDEPRETRDSLLAGLDRLRALEDARATHLQRLLEASSLMRRTVELGMSQHSDAREADRAVTMALAALEHDL